MILEHKKIFGCVRARQPPEFRGQKILVKKLPKNGIFLEKLESGDFLNAQLYNLNK